VIPIGAECYLHTDYRHIITHGILAKSPVVYWLVPVSPQLLTVGFVDNLQSTVALVPEFTISTALLSHSVGFSNR
jgi:hypothetical protein